MILNLHCLNFYGDSIDIDEQLTMNGTTKMLKHAKKMVKKSSESKNSTKIVEYKYYTTVFLGLF